MKPEKVKKRDKPLSVAKKEEGSGSLSFYKLVFANFLGGAIAVVFIYVIFSPWVSGTEADELARADKLKPVIQGYYWMYNTMLKGNLKTIEDYPDLTIYQRYEAKSPEIGVINKIKQQTPDSAIIIMPPKKLLTQVKLTSAVELPWLTYFVYPRKVIYEDEKDTSKLYAQATYIMALEGWGLDKLNYRVERPEALMILPLKK